MKLDNIIQTLLPHDEKFYHYFEESAQILFDASLLLKKFASVTSEERKTLSQEISEHEHRADTVAHKVFAELSATFVTPFDREDIHHLASALDDILDFLDGSAHRFILYKIKECPPEMGQLIETLHLSIAELVKGKNLGFARSAREVLERIANTDDSHSISRAAFLALEAVRQTGQAAEEKTLDDQIGRAHV